MAYGSSSFGSEAYGSSSNITPLGVITYFLSGHLSKANITITLTLDARIVSRPEKTFTLDARIVSRPEKTFTLDASLRKLFLKTFTINAYLKKFVAEKTFIIDSRLVFRKEKSFGFDSTLQKTLTTTFGIGARAYIKIGWLFPWKHRKSIIICGTTAGVQTNYPIKFTVYKGYGTDSGNSIYLGNDVKDDFSDIRFTKQDGKTTLSYWIQTEEYIEGVSAVVWVKVDYIPNSPDNTSIYLYYRNTGATSLSNEQNIFLLFDEFDGNSLDSSKWVGNGAGISVHDGYLDMTGDSLRTVISLNNIGLNISVEASVMRVTPIHEGELGTLTRYTSNIYTSYAGWNFNKASEIAVANTTAIIRNYINVASISQTLDSYEFYKTIHSVYGNPGENTRISCSFDNASPVTYVDMNGLSGQKIGFWQNYDDAYVDYVRVRKYSYPEPIVCGIGSQENYSVTRNIFRTHRVGLRIING